MRNLIAATADRPIPLPDRILSDGWWLIERAEPIAETRRLWAVTSEEGARERDSSEGRPQPLRIGR
jgi:hypothetical protein